MGRHVSQYRMHYPTANLWVVYCPDDRLGLCGGHNFTTKKAARNWIAQEEERK